MAENRPYPRRAFWKLFAEWWRKNAKLLASLLGAYIVLAGVAMTSAVLLGGAVNSFAAGLAVGVLVVLAPFLVTVAFLVTHPTAVRQLRGAWGEDNTRDVLKTAKRRGLVWGSIHGLALQAGDIDHIVATRAGGIVAIDTKWRSVIAAGDPEKLAGEANRMRLRVEGLVHTVLESERGKHRGRPGRVRVTPVVVLWGPAQRGVPDGTPIDGVVFVSGEGLAGWLRTLDGAPLAKDVSRELLTALSDFDRKRSASTVAKSARVTV